ncbi:hypothetical protein HYS91_04200 [Candidatus Daviesbacteria bacterium]|nr:hypothetical protein [Candidatus Daviesbacteria bacterium]
MKVLIISIASILVLAAIALIFFHFPKNRKFNNESLPNTISSPSAQPTTTNLQASFTIKTDNIIRIFTNSKYHNQSEDVYITPDNPSRVNVKKTGITWADFFNTLPMKLTKDCLVTGDGETLCRNEASSLKFYLNDREDPDLLDKEIKNGDKLLVIFKSNG